MPADNDIRYAARRIKLERLAPAQSRRAGNIQRPEVHNHSFDQFIPSSSERNPLILGTTPSNRPLTGVLLHAFLY
jgi:hypothetical protein